MPSASASRPFRSSIATWSRGLLVAGCLVFLAAHGDTWGEIQRRGILRWGNDAEGGIPYIYHPPDRPTELVGFEVEFANALAERLGVRSEFVQNNWDMLVPALQDGSHFDVIIAGLERSPENLAKIDMSRPYFIYGQQLVVPAADTHTARLEDLRGKRVGVLSASGSHHLADRTDGIDVRVYQDNVNYFSDLELGRLDAVLTDTPIAQANLAGRPALHPAGTPFALGAYAVGVRTGDTNLLLRINDAIGTLAVDGSLERIYRRYSLWNSDQQALRDWHEETRSASPQRHSVLREWRTYLPFLLEASVTTIWVTCGGMVLAVTWGLVLALLRLYGPAPVRWLSVAYIEVFRGTPLLLQIYFIYFGLAQQLGLRLSAGAAAVLSLGLNYAASEAENYRAGIQAVPRGQTEAALALGMSRSLMLRRVILPQSLRISLPSVTNDFIAMFKDSSIVSVIALVELTKAYQIRAIDTGDYIGLGILTAAIYFTLSYAASQGARWLERRMHRDTR
ncbi:MAG: ABC transporter permease subunit [Verrucomicrobiales bacterium]|nr:ABC transporter permease subunit [Verrucomicrobiales bacterium]